MMDEMMKIEAMMMDAMVDVMFDWARGRHSNSPSRSGLLQFAKAEASKSTERATRRTILEKFQVCLGTADSRRRTVQGEG